MSKLADEWNCDDCGARCRSGALCDCWTKAVEPPRATTGSRRLNEAMYDTWVEHMAMPEPGSDDGLVRPYMACACGWRSDDLLGDDTWICSNNPGNSYAIHLANHLHDAAIEALAGRPIAPNPPPRLVVCNLSWCGESDVHAHVVPVPAQETDRG